MFMTVINEPLWMIHKEKKRDDTAENTGDDVIGNSRFFYLIIYYLSVFPYTYFHCTF